MKIKYIIALLATTYFQPVLADIENGKGIHNENCLKCHQTAVYERADRKVKDLGRLNGQVSMCIQNLNLDIFPEDEKDIAAYLNKEHYHFK